MVPRPARAPVGRVTDRYRRFCLIAARMNNVQRGSHTPIDTFRAALVSEVSTALTYQDLEQEKSLAVVSGIMLAYHADMPLAPHELDVVLDLLRAPRAPRYRREGECIVDF